MSDGVRIVIFDRQINAYKLHGRILGQRRSCSSALHSSQYHHQSVRVSRWNLMCDYDTHINPNWALGDQANLSTVLHLCCHESQHILAASEELKSSRVVDAGLCFVEALLWNVSICQLIMLIFTYKSILLASSAIACMRFQEAPVNELQIRLDAAWRRLCLTSRFESKDKNSRNEQSENTQRQSQLLERVPRDVC